MENKQIDSKEIIKKVIFNKRTVFTIVAMVNIIWYTIFVLIANCHGHHIQEDITIAWFTAWTVELALLCGIQISKKS